MQQWEKNLLAKHEQQMHAHQSRYGKLGEPQTKAQKMRLAQDLKRMEKAS